MRRQYSPLERTTLWLALLTIIVLSAGCTFQLIEPPAVEPAIAEQPAVAWYGLVVDLPDDADFDDYLALLPSGAGEVGIAGVNSVLDAEIADVHDRNIYAHIWGTLTCGVSDYGGCQLVVTHLRPDEPGPFCGFYPVDDWVGSIVSVQPGAGEQFDDSFQLAGDFPVTFGIASSDAAIASHIEDLRDKATRIHVWGNISCGVPDVNGTQIDVTRIEVD